MTRALVLAVLLLLGCKSKGEHEAAIDQPVAAAPADAAVRAGSSNDSSAPIEPAGPTRLVYPRVDRRAAIATKPEPYPFAMLAIVDAKGNVSVARATPAWRDHLPAIRTPLAHLEDLADTVRAPSLAGSGSAPEPPPALPDGPIHVRRVPDDPVLDRGEAIETLRQLEENRIGGRGHAIGARAIRVERLGVRNPLVLAAANAPAATLARVLAVAGGALAVTSEDRPEILALGFVAPGSNHDRAWIELHVAADGIHVVDATGAGAPVVVAWDKGTFDGKVLAAAIEKLGAPADVEIDVLVGEGVSAQQLVGILETLDAASARRVGVGVLGGPPGDREAALRRGRDARARPVASLGIASTVGDLDKAIVRRYITRNLERIRGCYEKELVARPKLAGTVTSTFVIAATGAVQRSTASGVDPAVATCVAEVIKTIEFPKPKSGGTVQVSFPFAFRPTGD